MDSRQRPNYGIDAPNIARNFFLLVALGLGLSYWLRFLLIPSAIFLVEGFIMLWGSKYGKLRVRDKLLSSVSWHGNERVLDVGCGHGLLLIGAAKRLSEGKAVGIDLWKKEDQAGNSREATLRNIQLENVADRVELVDGDARKLPFGDETFDIVLSSWALHNIYDRAGRDTAIREIVRVLKPGGQLRIMDIRHTSQYADVLRQSQMSDVQRTRPNFIFMTPSFTVMARKRPVS